VLSAYSSTFSEMGCFPTHLPLPRLVRALLAHFKFQGQFLLPGYPCRRRVAACCPLLAHTG
jgi:hypothetical protein